MSLCNECWGKGLIEKQCVQFDCRKCKGTGVIENEPHTNEEWIHTLNTEQLAEVLADVSLWIHPFMKQKNRFELLKKQFYEWLKQPHAEKE